MNATATIETITTMGGIPFHPVKFTATYQGNTWHATKVNDEIHLTRICTGCWSPRNPGMWTTNRHIDERTVTVAEITDYEERTNRLRALGLDDLVDIIAQRDASAFRIIRH